MNFLLLNSSTEDNGVFIQLKLIQCWFNSVSESLSASIQFKSECVSAVKLRTEY